MAHVAFGPADHHRRLGEATRSARRPIPQPLEPKAVRQVPSLFRVCLWSSGRCRRTLSAERVPLAFDPGGSMFGRKRATQPVAEFLGTYALVSAVLAMASLTDSPFFPAVAAGLTLGVMVLVIGPLSGAHINPAVSFGLWTLRKVPASTALVFVAAQMLAGFTALKMNEYLLDESVPSLTSSSWDWRIVLAEGIGMLIFTFGIIADVRPTRELG
jgi:hypothetical protein